jgi:hypothetical protein
MEPCESLRLAVTAGQRNVDDARRHDATAERDSGTRQAARNWVAVAQSYKRWNMRRTEVCTLEVLFVPGSIRAAGAAVRKPLCLNYMVSAEGLGPSTHDY